MLFYLLLDLVVVIALIVLAFVVLVRDWHAERNRIFALFSLSICAWVIANYISNVTSLHPGVAQTADYFVFFFSYAAGVMLLRFAISLAGNAAAKKQFKRLAPLLAVVGLMTLVPGAVVKGVTLQGNVYAVEFGPGIGPFGVVLLGVLVAAVLVTRKGIKRSTGDQRAALLVLYDSVRWALPITLLMEFILPTTIGWFGLTNVGILPMLIVVFGLYYGVLKHRMFDLRFFVLRASVYFLTNLLLGTLYIAPIIFLLDTFVLHADFKPVTFILGVIVALLIASYYSRVHTGFDKATNKIFFRDSYDSAAFLGDLSRVLVSSIDLNTLLHKSADLIVARLKVEFMVFILNDTADVKRRAVGVGRKELEMVDIKQAIKSAGSTEPIITDYLTDDMQQVKTVLLRNDIAAVIPLSSNRADVHETLGYMLIGFKKSGNPFDSQDIHTLISAADAAVIAIQNALRFEEIQNFNVTLQERITEATAQLRRTNAKLRMLDETKDDFISMASHQLRTPLTSVKGYLSMVLEGDAGKLTSMQHKMLDQAFVSSQRMVSLIADLLNVSRLKTGKFIIESSWVDLSKTVADEVKQLKETAKSRSLELIYDKPTDFPMLMIDETKIRQVIMNFIDNAIYYTPAGGKINVQLLNNSDSVELRVTDTGIGVPKREQPHLFTKFYRAGNARQARPDGTGLGLFMAKKVIVAQGGAVIFESEEGKGSTFGFIFSKAKLMTPPAAPHAQAVHH